MAGNNSKFKGISHYSQETLTNQVEKNFTDFFNYAILEIGGFFNVRTPESGLYGGQKDKLRLVDEPNFAKGRIWEGFRNDWVWETGIDYRTKPIRVSGVKVNGTFHPTTGTGPFAHIVDYPKGRIIFNSPISTTATVQCSFTHRAVTFTNTDAPWFQEIQRNSYRVDNNTYLQFGSGNWNQLGETRIPLPAVALDTVFRPNAPGLELGGGQKIQHMLGFYIISDTSTDRNKIADIISTQNEKKLTLYNINAVPRHLQPLDISGSPTVSGLSYPQLIAASSDGGFRWRDARIINTQVRKLETFHPKLFSAEVLMTLEIDMFDM